MAADMFSNCFHFPRFTKKNALLARQSHFSRKSLNKLCKSFCDFAVKFLCKVLSLLEACFALISSPSPSMKIQIIDGKITENLGFESPLRKVKTFSVLFLFIFKFSIKNCISLYLTIFEYLVLQIRYQ